MTDTAQNTVSNSRLVGKERRREQLIRSTINCIANKGIAGTTMADVTKDAGLSLGIVNLHFQSKERLFEETLRFLSDEYEELYINAIAKTGDTAEDKLAALVKLDFSPKVCDRKKLAVWFAFWGEAKSRPTYLQICAKTDNTNTEVVSRLAEELKSYPDYVNVNSKSFATGLGALVNGLWLDLLMTPKEITPREARNICFDYLAANFPKHFEKTS